MELICGPKRYRSPSTMVITPLSWDLMRSTTLWILWFSVNTPCISRFRLDKGHPLTPRTTLQSVPYAQISGSAESVDGGAVNATDISISSQPVINNQGEWVGPAISVSWSDIAPSTIPGDIADGDNDTQLSETAVEGYITNGAIGLAPASSIQGEGVILTESSVIPWSQLDASTIPSDLLDGDNDTLASLSCATGEIASWGGGGWICTSDNTLDATALGTLLSNNGVDLNQNTTIGGLDILTPLDDSDTLANLSCINDGDIPKYDLVNGSWYCDAETGLSASQVVAAVEGAEQFKPPSGTKLVAHRYSLVVQRYWSTGYPPFHQDYQMEMMY